MIEFDPEQFEAELRTLKPAKPSSNSLRQLQSRLTDGGNASVDAERSIHKNFAWLSLLRWLAPAAAAAGIAALLFPHFHHVPTKLADASPEPVSSSAAPQAVLKADQVEIDRRLVADFDAVTELPGGQPVRFRCEQWLDKVRLRDRAAGLVIERTTPRVEIVPVRFDTY